MIKVFESFCSTKHSDVCNTVFGVVEDKERVALNRLFRGKSFSEVDVYKLRTEGSFYLSVIKSGVLHSCFPAFLLGCIEDPKGDLAFSVEFWIEGNMAIIKGRFFRKYNQQQMRLIADIYRMIKVARYGEANEPLEKMVETICCGF